MLLRADDYNVEKLYHLWFDTVRNYNGFKTTATRECRWTYSNNAIGDGKISQASTTIKSIVFYISNAIRDDYRRQTTAVEENGGIELRALLKSTVLNLFVLHNTRSFSHSL